MRVIAIEEAYSHAALQNPDAMANLRKHAQLARIQDRLEDVGQGRIADMDAAGIDMPAALAAYDLARRPRTQDRVRASNEIRIHRIDSGRCTFGSGLATAAPG